MPHVAFRLASFTAPATAAGERCRHQAVPEVGRVPALGMECRRRVAGVSGFRSPVAAKGTEEEDCMLPLEARGVVAVAEQT
jgi:hypothetical protein